MLTFIFTGKLINFGNFSLITKKDAETIIKDPTIIYCFQGTLKKNKITKLGNINCIRGKDILAHQRCLFKINNSFIFNYSRF